MTVRITGEHNFPGKMLLVAMQKAHAATTGSLAIKQAAGVDRLNQYLETNPARKRAWGLLTPDVAVARASLNGKELEAAGRALEAATDVEQRRTLLAQVITPFLSSSQVTLFGLPVGESENTKPKEIEAGALADKLEPNLPENELVLVANPGHGVISPQQVTNEQYRIFINQTGHRLPCYWNDSDPDRQQLTKSVVNVDFKHDATGFAKWQGRSVPTEPAFLSAKEANRLTANKPREWTSTNEGGWQIIRSLTDSYRGNDEAGYSYGHVAFRVAGT